MALVHMITILVISGVVFGNPWRQVWTNALVNSCRQLQNSFTIYIVGSLTASDSRDFTHNTHHPDPRKEQSQEEEKF